MPRFLIRFLRLAILLLASTLLPITGAQAADYVSVNAHDVNVRQQPTTRAQAEWVLDRGYPLRVLERRGKWLKVADHEATLGWIHAPLTSKTPHRIVSARRANLRAGPSTGQRLLATLERGETLRTLGTRGGWVRVQRENGQRGWISARLTWGW